MLKFTTNKTSISLMGLIADRVFAEVPNYPDDRQSLLMDLSATNANGCPIDFARLLEFPTFDFLHDIYGIRRHINRRTGELEDCFLPRCSLSTKPKVSK